jgi:hypothetical protein
MLIVQQAALVYLSGIYSAGFFDEELGNSL